MFKRRTVFIVGAGASCELGFPSGQQLLERIAASLNLRWGHYEEKASGDPELRDYFRRLAQEAGLSSNPWAEIAHRIRAAAAGAGSIDTVIDQNDDDERVAQVAKAAIAVEIERAEAKSKLAVPRDRIDYLDCSTIQNTWLGPFFSMVRRKKSEIEILFDNISVISFNYDRSLERYLPFAISQAYGAPMPEAEKLAAGLEVLHPYGTLGTLGTLAGSGATHVPYGDLGRPGIGGAVERIRTFSERLRSHELSIIREHVQHAQTLIFLGFGFHSANMELITPSAPMEVEQIFATTFEVPGPAATAYRGRIQDMVDASRHGHANPSPVWYITPQKCCEFLKDYGPLLTS